LLLRNAFLGLVFALEMLFGLDGLPPASAAAAAAFDRGDIDALNFGSLFAMSVS